MLTLGAQPEVWRLSDDPVSSILVVPLLGWRCRYGSEAVFFGGWPEILWDLRLRRLHVTASVLAELLFVMQGITGTRDLLEIPLSWQKPAVYACDFDLQSCP